MGALPEAGSQPGNPTNPVAGILAPTKEVLGQSHSQDQGEEQNRRGGTSHSCKTIR
jgi:hypothetical protein